MVPDFIVVGLFVVVFVLLGLGLCRAAGRADANTEACLAQREGGQRGPVPQPAREAIQRGLEVGKRLRVHEAVALTRRRPWIGRDQETPARRGRVKAMQRHRRGARVQVEPCVELVSDDQVLDVRPTLPAAMVRAREILADRAQGVQVIYFHDARTDCYRGWLRIEDLA